MPFPFVVAHQMLQPFFLPPFAQPAFEIGQRRINGWIIVCTFPDHAALVHRADKRGEIAVVAVADFDPADGVDKVGDVGVGGESVGHRT